MMIILPLELQERILLMLTFKDAVSYCNSCRLARSVTLDNHFWREKAYIDGYPRELFDEYISSFHRCCQLHSYGRLIYNNETLFRKVIDNKDSLLLKHLARKAKTDILIESLSYSVSSDNEAMAEILCQHVVLSIPFDFDSLPIYRLSHAMRGVLENALINAGLKGYYNVVVYIVINIKTESLKGVTLRYLVGSCDLASIKRAIKEFSPSVFDFNDSVVEIIHRSYPLYDRDRHIDILKYLLENHPDVTRLNYIIDRFIDVLKVDMALILIDYGVGVNNLLQLAVYGRNIPVIDMLIDNFIFSESEKDALMTRTVKLKYNEVLLQKLSNIRTSQEIINALDAHYGLSY